jgi:diguanylate cyclase (GGDEF)-like protein
VISIEQAHSTGEPRQRERLGRRVTGAHAATFAFIAIMAIGAFCTLERAIHVQRDSASAIALVERQSMLSGRVAILVAQEALGNGGVRDELSTDLDALESTHWRLIAGDPSTSMTSAMIDPQLKALYYGGNAPLDAAATLFVMQARRIATDSTKNRAAVRRGAQAFLATERPLLDALASANRVREASANRDLAQIVELGAAIAAATFAALIAATLSVFRPMARRISELTQDIKDLSELATLDPTTGMLNNRSFQARGTIELEKARRYKRPVSLLMIDADHLPAIEAAYGPDGGESVLKALTSSLFDGTRVSDLIARVDDERFAILLPETATAGAELLAERLRRKIGDLKVRVKDKSVSCTISVGVAAAEQDATFLWSTLQRADRALCEAKMGGRNRVVVAA